MVLLWHHVKTFSFWNLLSGRIHQNRCFCRFASNHGSSHLSIDKEVMEKSVVVVNHTFTIFKSQG